MKSGIDPICGRQGEMEERGRSVQIGGGSFNEQENLHLKLVLRSCKTCRSSYQPAGILSLYKVYMCSVMYTDWSQQCLTLPRLSP